MTEIKAGDAAYNIHNKWVHEVLWVDLDWDEILVRYKEDSAFVDIASNYKKLEFEVGRSYTYDKTKGWLANRNRVFKVVAIEGDFAVMTYKDPNVTVIQTVAVALDRRIDFIEAGSGG